MLLRSETLDGIARGEIGLAFRRWKRPTVRAGGTLLTPVGQLQIGSVTPIDLISITPEDAARAGHASRQALIAELNRRDDGEIYRVEFVGIRPDPRVALRALPLDATQLDQIRSLLARLDAASSAGPWTLRTLEAIRDHAGLRAGDLGRLIGYERDRFKNNVRKLKALGLTISLEVGYRLSPRGEAYLETASSAEAEPASDA